jgi:hypothetical protein
LYVFLTDALHCVALQVASGLYKSCGFREHSSEEKYANTLSLGEPAAAAAAVVLKVDTALSNHHSLHAMLLLLPLCHLACAVLKAGGLVFAHVCAWCDDVG